MDEQHEMNQARLLADIMDGRSGMKAAAEINEVLEAAVTANMLRQGFGDVPTLDAAFDRDLRHLLVVQAAQRARVVPLYRKPWAQAALAAALIVLIIGPLMMLRDLSGKYGFGDENIKKQKTIQYYDKMYESRVDRLRRQLKSSEPEDITVRTSLLRSDERFERLKEKRQEERRMSRFREYTSGGNEI